MSISPTDKTPLQPPLANPNPASIPAPKGDADGDGDSGSEGAERVRSSAGKGVGGNLDKTV